MDAIQQNEDGLLDEQEAQPARPGVEIEAIVGAGDISSRLTDTQIDEIITEALDGYERDLASRTDWQSAYDRGKKALFSDNARKDTPFPNASNARYPLLLDASVQFGARVNKGFVKGDRIAQPGVIGFDPDQSKKRRSERVSKFISMQALEMRTAWKTEHKKLLYNLPLAGTAFKKVTWDAANNTWLSRLVLAEDVIFDNGVVSFEELPRLAHQIKRYPYQIQEKMRAGAYRDVDLQMDDGGDAQAVQMLLECHILYDLDGDGYPEPYLATIHKEARQLLRFEANYVGSDIRRGVRHEVQVQQIQTMDQSTGAVVLTAVPVQVAVPGPVVQVKRRDYFVPYHFIPDPAGGFLSMGFAQMLGATQDVIDTLLNQIIDAGTLANSGGGFIGRGLDFRERGPIRFLPGEYKMVDATGPDLRASIVPMQFPPANPVLLQVMGLMIDAGRSTASITDVLTGSVEKNMQPTTVMMLVEQGLQVFGDVVEGVFDSMTHELRLAYELNAIYLPDDVYSALLDAPEPEPGAPGVPPQPISARQDFAADMAVRPVGDPKAITDVQRLMRADYLRQFLGQPGIDNREIQMRLLEAGGIDGVEKILPPQQGPNPQEVAGMEMAKLQAQKAAAEVIEILSKAMKNVAQAEAAEAGQQAQQYAGLIQSLVPMLMGGQPNQGATNGQAQAFMGGGGGLPGLAGGGGVAMVSPSPGSMGRGAPGPRALLGAEPGGAGGPAGPGGIARPDGDIGQH
jgi:chaperonin GroES